MHLPLAKQPSFRAAVSRFALATAILLVGAAANAAAKTITVTNGHDHGPGTLRAAIAKAVSGDTIAFASGVTKVTLTTAGLSIADKNLIIKGRGAKKLAIRRSATADTPQFTIFEIFNHKVTLSGLTIANGLNDNGSGGIEFVSGTLTVSGCAITGNKGSNGGGIGMDSGDLAVRGCTISGNSTPEGFGGGGVIINSGTALITRSTIAGNSAAGAGGIYNFGTFTLMDSTVASNHVTGNAGGVWNWPGTASDPIVFKAKNSIIAQNTDVNGKPDFDGKLTSLGFNLIGNTGGSTVEGQTTSNVTNVDPLLGDLQDNGGPTKTKALLAGSPAIDKGNSGTATVDQRKLPRPVDNLAIENAGGGNASDIGAFEVQTAGTANAAIEGVDSSAGDEE